VLHVGLNLIFLVPGRTGGMEVAARETIARLAERDDLRLTAFVNREAAGTAWGRGVEEVVVPVHATTGCSGCWASRVLLPVLARRAGVDVLHSMGGTGPVAGGGRRVTTIHDLAYKLLPAAHLGIRGRVMAGSSPPAALARAPCSWSGSTRWTSRPPAPATRADRVVHGRRAPTARARDAASRGGARLGSRPGLPCPERERQASAQNLVRLFPR
jgi:hypothetical protein